MLQWQKLLTSQTKLGEDWPVLNQNWNRDQNDAIKEQTHKKLDYDEKQSAAWERSSSQEVHRQAVWQEHVHLHVPPCFLCSQVSVAPCHCTQDKTGRGEQVPEGRLYRDSWIKCDQVNCCWFCSSSNLCPQFLTLSICTYFPFPFALVVGFSLYFGKVLFRHFTLYLQATALAQMLQKQVVNDQPGESDSASAACFLSVLYEFSLYWIL